jgi:hypothetical protein
MVVTFENDIDVIVYALEKVISYARRTQQIFVAQCVWWLASIIGLEQGLIAHIDNIEQSGNSDSEQNHLGSIHPDRIQQVEYVRTVSPVPRDLTEDQRLDRILDSAERVIQESFRDRSQIQFNRVNPLPSTKNQLKKARKVKRLQDAKRKEEVERSQRLQKIRATVIENLSKE